MEALEERLQEPLPKKVSLPRDESDTTLAAVENLLTPSTKFKMAKAHIEMAQKFETESNIPSALGHLRQGNSVNVSDFTPVPSFVCLLFVVVFFLCWHSLKV